MDRIALIDVDGVCADFTTGILNRIGSDLRLSDINRWEFLDIIAKHDGLEAKKYALSILETPEFWLNLDEITLARDGVNKIRRAGFETVFVTSPWLACVGWENARRQWLSRHLDAKSHSLIVTERKELIDGDLFIDDKPETVEHWELMRLRRQARLFMAARLFDAPYNQGATGLIRMYGWGDIDELIRLLKTKL